MNGNKQASPSDLVDYEEINAIRNLVDEEKVSDYGYSNDFVDALKQKYQFEKSQTGTNKKKKFEWPIKTSKESKKLRNFWYNHSKSLQIDDDGAVSIKKQAFYKVYTNETDEAEYEEISKKAYNKYLKERKKLKFQLAKDMKRVKLLERKNAQKVFDHVHNTGPGHRGTCCCFPIQYCCALYIVGFGCFFAFVRYQCSGICNFTKLYLSSYERNG